MAAQIHDAIAAERSVDIKLPPPPPPPPAAPDRRRRTSGAVASRASTCAAPPTTRPAAPAQAGQIAAATDAPLDFTGSAFVVGSGSTYAGGTTTARGTSRAPVAGAVAPNGHGDGQVAARSRAKPVSLDQASWNCPWPAEADARQVDQETVVIRVAVRPDGRVERADVLDDPGFGFGRAARDCALSSRAFAPALDANGAPSAGCPRRFGSIFTDERAAGMWAAALAAAMLAGCHRHVATPADCRAILNRLVEMELASPASAIRPWSRAGRTSWRAGSTTICAGAGRCACATI